MSSHLNPIGDMLDAVADIRLAFGAPGDHGYGTREGDALFRLYKAAVAIMGNKLPHTAAAADVLAERQRQIIAEGFSPERDDGYRRQELPLAAACYALRQTAYGEDVKFIWPWDNVWFKPADPRRDLVKAGALILAEIERLDRAEASGAP